MVSACSAMRLPLVSEKLGATSAHAEEAIRLEPNKKGATIHWRIVQSLQKKAEAAKAAGSEHDHYKFLEMAKAAAGKALAHKASMPAASQAEWQADKSFKKIEEAHAQKLPPPPAAVEAASGEGEAGPSRLKSDASAAEGASASTSAERFCSRRPPDAVKKIARFRRSSAWQPAMQPAPVKKASQER